MRYCDVLRPAACDACLTPLPFRHATQCCTKGGRWRRAWAPPYAVRFRTGPIRALPAPAPVLLPGAPFSLHLRRRCNNADRASALADAVPSDAWTGCCLIGFCDSCLLVFGIRLCAGLNVKQNWEGTGAAINDAPPGTTCTRRRDPGPLAKKLFSAALSLSLFPGAHGMLNYSAVVESSHVFHRGMIFVHCFEFGQTLDLAEHILQLQMPGIKHCCPPRKSK